MQSVHYNEMTKRANAQRRTGESDAQCFARYSATPEGRALMAKHQTEQLGDSLSYLPTPQEFVPVNKASNNVANWTALVAGIKKIQGGSEMEAIEAALSTEEGRSAFELAKWSQRAGDVSLNDIMFEGMISGEHAAIRAEKRARTKSRFEEIGDNIRRRDPTLTQSKAMDLARSTPDGKKAWDEWFKLGVPGNPNNGMGQSSGRTPSMWTGESGASGANQRGPDFNVEQMDGPEAVRFKSAADANKAWRGLIQKVMDATNLPPTRVVELLRRHPVGQSIYDAAMAA
jgi:hypothetical protein